MEVKFIDLKAGKGKLYKNVAEDLKQIITNASFVGGSYLEEFEKKFADYNGVKHCIGVGSGTDALWLALLALGVNPGDEVIVPSNTFIATAFAVTQALANVVFVDVDPKTYNIDVNKLEKAITARTKAIMPVHLYGQPCDMDSVLSVASKYNLLVIEDCAQAAGAELNGRKASSFGDAGCFSFYPTKNLAGLAQGGAVLTNSDNVDDAVRSLGNVGRSKTSHTGFDYVGFNSRLDTINAAYLSKSLDNLDKDNEKRINIAQMYNDSFKDLPIITPFVPENNKHVYHIYNIQLKAELERDSLQSHLKIYGVGSGVYYPIPCHKQSMYDFGKLKLTVSEKLSKTTLALPMYAELGMNKVKYVCDKIKEFYKDK